MANLTDICKNGLVRRLLVPWLGDRIPVLMAGNSSLKAGKAPEGSTCVIQVIEASRRLAWKKFADPMKV